MTWRWYGEGNDQIKLSDIKQIPGVEGIVWALHNKMPGEVWELDEIAEVQQQLKPYGFNMDVVEITGSVASHEHVIIGVPFFQELRNAECFASYILGQQNIHMIQHLDAPIGLDQIFHNNYILHFYGFLLLRPNQK